MADVEHSPQTPVAPAASPAGSKVVVCLPSVTADILHQVLDLLYTGLRDRNVLVASPDAPTDAVDPSGPLQIVPYPSQPSHAGWVLTALDYAAAAGLVLEHSAGAVIVLGPEAASLSPSAVQSLVAAVEDGADLALPRYTLGTHEGLVNAALLYPLSRSLFGAEAHIPLPVDVAFSARMASRLNTVARKPTSTPGAEALIWPAAEATIASLSIREVPVGHRTLPSPDSSDLNSVLAYIAGSLFADLETKASFWQRARATPPTSVTAPAATASAATLSDEDAEEIRSMAEGFRNAYANLQSIWSLVVPPQSLLALKKLSLSSPEAFVMPANLWARTVFDFVLAYRLRTINRGHLLGALTPLYLAWVASHLRQANNDAVAAEQHIEETAAAFVAERPYVLARWRWPDRFNP